MDYARPLLLDGAKQPVLLPDEVTYRLQGDVTLYEGDLKTHRTHGTALLTSHRLGWLDASRTDCVFWQHGNVARTEVEEAGFFAGSAKVVVRLEYAGPAGRSGAYPALAPSGASAVRNVTIRLSFKTGGRDAFAEDFKRALSRRGWVVGEGASSAPKRGRIDDGSGTAPARPVGVGMGALFAQEAARAEAGRALAQTAFSDLEVLMQHGKKIAEMAESYARELSRTVAPAPTGGSGGVDADSEAAGSLLAGLGIVTPVTRDATGSLFTTELARQLAGFLTPLLASLGGLCPLTDVYVAFNRARGTEPVSPEDLLAAARLLGPAPPAGLGLGLHLTTLPGGVCAVVLDSFSPAEMCKRLAGLAAAGARTGSYSFTTAQAVATALRTPLAVAEHHLAAATRDGALAVDNSINGLRYFANAIQST